MKRFFTLTLRFVLVLGATHTVFADPLQWELSTLTFSATSFPGGVVSTGSVTGLFTYDADTGHFATWSIELSGFPGTPVPATGLLLTPANSSSPCMTNCFPTQFDIFDPTHTTAFTLLDLTFTQPLTDAGGTVPVDTGMLATLLFLDTPNFSTFSLQSPGGSASAVPEPSSAALTLVVAIGFGMLFMRRLRHSCPKRSR
jgi:hypothetical protein